MFSPCKEMEPSAPEKRGPGRPRLPTPERRRNVLASKAKWRLENHEYSLNQKRELASRPEYLTRRRELRANKRTCIWQDDTPVVGPPCHYPAMQGRCGPVPDDARKSILDYATLDNIQIAYSSKMDAQPP